MKVWNTIVVDDEPYARLDIIKMLKEHSFINIIGEADSLSSAKKVIKERKPDLVFLDIDLGANTGFDLLEYFEPKFHVIFVTAYDEFAIRAFEVNALDYLLKPVHPERLKESLKRLGSPYKEEKHIQLKPYDKILLNQHTSSRFITVESISYIEACGDYTRVFTSQNISGIMHQTIKKWIERLPEISFIQVHRSYIVNLNHIEKLSKEENNRYSIKLRNIEKGIPVSKSYSKKLRDKYAIR